MLVQTPPFGNPYYLGYLFAYGVAGLVCFGGIVRALEVPDRDTRHGLVALLGTSGGWAVAHVGFLLVTSAPLKSGIYIGGLLLGFGTVWSWLYFCSAYTGRSLHRDPSIWRLAAVLFGVVALVKLTNPLHELYYSIQFASEPFLHLTIRHHLLYWVIMGVSYALATAGYFMLVELFTEIGNDATPLLVLTGLTALPAVLNMIGHAQPSLLDITHEPLGVAVFTVGVLFVYATQFEAVRLAGEHDDPAIVLSEDGRIRDYSDGAAGLFPELSRASEGEALDAVLPNLAEILDEESPLLTLEQDARTRYFRVTRNQFGAGGGRLGQILLLADVTEQKEREDRLREAKEQAEQANRLKSAMLANMSHELRTPLTAINGYAEMLEETLEGQPELFAEKIHKGGRRLTRTLDSVLDLSQLEAGTYELERELVDVGAVVEETAELLRPEAEKKALTLEVDGPSDSLTAPLNEEAVTRIAENLIENAIKFTPEGGQIDVHVRTEGEVLALEVADTGVGIEEEAVPQIFEAFRQESEGMDREYEGTGLGLTIVKRLTDALDGSIEIESAKEEGTRVVVRLPTEGGGRRRQCSAGHFLEF